MKKMYNQPITEVAAFKTEHLMESETASPAGGDGPGTNDMPRRGTPIE